MKAAAVALLAGYLVADVLAQEEILVYVPSNNITCKQDATSGDITCEPGHLYGAEEFDPAAESVIEERDTGDLEKRLTCNLSDKGCFAHCFAIGYCNSHCNSKNICICNCKDKTQWWNPIVCSKTSC